MSIFRLHFPNLLLAIPQSSQSFLLLLCYHERHTRRATLNLRGCHRLINDMQLGTLLEADSVTLTCTREPDGKFKVRSGTSSVETVILADQVLEVRFRQGSLHPLGRQGARPGGPAAVDEGRDRLGRERLGGAGWKRRFTGE